MLWPPCCAFGYQPHHKESGVAIYRYDRLDYSALAEWSELEFELLIEGMRGLRVGLEDENGMQVSKGKEKCLKPTAMHSC